MGTFAGRQVVKGIKFSPLDHYIFQNPSFGSKVIDSFSVQKSKTKLSMNQPPSDSDAFASLDSVKKNIPHLSRPLVV